MSDTPSAPRTLLVVNPAAGGGRAARALDRVLEELRPWGEFEIAVTRAAERRPAERLVRSAVAGGAARIAVLGGDGTASEALNGLLLPNGEIAPVDLALLPAGTGRDFARSAGLPRDPVAAARRAATITSTRRIDVGEVRFPDGRRRLFLNVASFGVSARIAHALEEHPELKRRAGALAFGLATLRAGVGYAPDDVEIAVDGGAVFRGPTAAVAIANGGWFGGGMHVAPRARIDDGQLEVVRFGDLARRDFALSLPLLYRGTHESHPRVSMVRGTLVRATPFGTRAVEIEADGEVVGALPATFGVLPGALRLLA